MNLIYLHHGHHPPSEGAESEAVMATGFSEQGHDEACGTAAPDLIHDFRRGSRLGRCPRDVGLE